MADPDKPGRQSTASIQALALLADAELPPQLALVFAGILRRLDELERALGDQCPG